MPIPATPTEVDGVALTDAASDFARRLIITIYSPDPMRPASSILQHTLRAFRKAWQLVDGVWIPRPLVRLGDDDSNAVLVNPESTPV